MENILLIGVVLAIFIGVTIFYYSLPYLLKLVNVTPEWIVVSIYSGVGTYAAVKSYKLISTPIILAVIYISGVSLLLLVTHGKKIKTVWVQLLTIITFLIFLAVGSLIAMPVFWPISLMMLALYLGILLSGWFVLSWVSLNGRKA